MKLNPKQVFHAHGNARAKCFWGAVTVVIALVAMGLVLSGHSRPSAGNAPQEETGFGNPTLPRGAAAGWDYLIDMVDANMTIAGSTAHDQTVAGGHEIRVRGQIWGYVGAVFQPVSGVTVSFNTTHSAQEYVFPQTGVTGSTGFFDFNLAVPQTFNVGGTYDLTPFVSGSVLYLHNYAGNHLTLTIENNYRFDKNGMTYTETGRWDARVARGQTLHVTGTIQEWNGVAWVAPLSSVTVSMTGDDPATTVFPGTPTTPGDSAFTIPITIPMDFPLDQAINLEPTVTNPTDKAFEVQNQWRQHWFTVDENYRVEIQVQSYWNLFRNQTTNVTVYVEEFSPSQESLVEKAGATVGVYARDQIAAPNDPWQLISEGYGTTNASGIAIVPIKPSFAWEVDDYNLIANLSGVPVGTEIENSNLPPNKYLEIEAETSITLTPASGSNIYLPNEIYNLVGTLRDDNQTGLDGYNVDLKKNETMDQSTRTTNAGRFSFSYRILETHGNLTFRVDFNPLTGNLRGCSSRNLSVLVVDSIAASYQFSNSTPEVGQNVTLSGTVNVGGTTVPVANKSLRVSIGTQQFDVTTDMNGFFQLNYTASQVGNFSLVLQLVNKDTNQVDQTASVTQQDALNVQQTTQPSNGQPGPRGDGLDWIPILVGVGIAAGAAAVFGVLAKKGVFKRGKKKKKVSLYGKELEVEPFVARAQELARQGRVKEAIAYLFVTYTKLLEAVWGIQRDPKKTIRELGVQLVQEERHTPEDIYPFIQKVEETMYSGNQIGKDDVLQAFELFTRMYQTLYHAPLKASIKI